VEWTERRPTNEVITLHDLGEGRIEWLKMVLTPLFPVKSMEQVEGMMDMVRNAPKVELEH
jgi:hypothetical protein